MKYKVHYERHSDRDCSKWTDFSEVLDLKDLYNLLKWMEKNRENHKLISIVPEG